MTAAMLSMLAWWAAIIPSLLLAHFALEVLLGLRRIPAAPRAGGTTSVAIVVPAHDEALLIAGTVTALRGAAGPATTVLVVADNCTDQTASLARAAGARVIERIDPQNRGKGFALAYARDMLSADPPDAIVVIDADCSVAGGSPEVLARYALELGEPVQSINLLAGSGQASPLVQLSNFAVTVKNLVRARGLYRLAGGITLFGTGMAFPWKIFRQLPLATAEAVEDLALALALAVQGTHVHLCEEAALTSDAAPLDDSLGQRRRWEHGFLANAARRGVPLLLRGVRSRSRHLVFLGAHLLVPPVALLFLVSGVCLLIGAALTPWAGPGPLSLLAGALLLATVATALAWWCEGRKDIGARGLLRAPLYILWKVPVYAGYFISRQTAWNRTRRAGEEH